jgi:hypothetical protein
VTSEQMDRAIRSGILVLAGFALGHYERFASQPQRMNDNAHA